MSSNQDDVAMVAVDGRDALAFVIIRPGDTDETISVEAAAHGMDKMAAAYTLRKVADHFEAQAAKEDPADGV